MDSEEKAEIQSKIENMDEPGAGLKDWTAIRVHLKRHDDEMVGDYEDDINTMLVFAGLFSAVVTAFIVDSYKWLQQDNTQVMIQLLFQISSQLPTPPPMPKFISTSSSSLGTASGDFRPSSSSVWINVLWLLSLVFSLTAALLGIIIKQWLREYLLWDSVLSPSREAVLLRHIRYAAWERWKVPAIISAVPAMLEIALVLFLCGSTILLWTLNFAVAFIVTLFGGTFFILACIVNLLPIFFHRCPYKSATGWTCLMAWKLARSWSRGLFARLRLASRHSRRPPIRRQSSSWRQRDLQRRTHWSAPIPRYLHPELDENVHIESSEFVVLFQALAWVCTSTHDDRLFAKVQQCAANFPSNARKFACLVPGMHAVCRIFSLDVAVFFQTLRDSFRHQQCDNTVYGSYLLVHRRAADIWQGHLPELPVFLMVGDVLCNVVEVCIEELFPSPALLGSGYQFPTQAEMHGFVEAFCFLVHLFPLQTPEWQHSLKKILIGFYDKLREAQFAFPWVTGEATLGPRFAGLSGTVFQLLSRIGTVDIDKQGRISADLGRLSAPGHYARLAIRILKQNIRGRQEERHLFVIIANEAIAFSAGQPIDDGALLELFVCMEDTLQPASQNVTKNCGYYGDLPWIDTLLDLRQMAADVFQRVPSSLIDALDTGAQSGIITGADLAGKLDRLRAPHVPNSSFLAASPTSTKASRKAKLTMSPDLVKVVAPERVASSSSQSTFGLSPTPFSWDQNDVELGTLPYSFPQPAQNGHHS